MARSTAAIQADIDANATAIAAARGLQSWSSEGTTITRASLGDLLKERTALYRELNLATCAAAETPGRGVFSRGVLEGFGNGG
jgi:hypothetical protein